MGLQASSRKKRWAPGESPSNSSWRWPWRRRAAPSGRYPRWSAADVGAPGRDAAAQAVAAADFAVAGRHWRLLEALAGGRASAQRERALLAQRLLAPIPFTWFAGVIWFRTAALDALGIQRVRTATLRTSHPALIKLPHCPLTCPACPCHTGDRFILTGGHRWRLVTELHECRRAQVPRGLHPPPERQRRLLAARGQAESRAHAIASHSARATCVCTRALPTHSLLRCSARAARVARRAA